MYNDSGIYVYRNKINGKKYVGQAKNLRRRYLNFKNANHRYCGNVFENARKKYGIDAFEYSILTHCPISELNYWEAFYVERLNTTVPNGYNMTKGGDSVYTSTQEFKDKAEKKLKEKIRKLNPKLDVSNIKYVDNFTPIKITCKEHGDFYKIPNHLHKADRYAGGLICPSCVKEMEQKKTEDTFFKRAKEKFGDEYLYDKTKVTSWRDKVTVTCKKHGDFSVMVGNHISKNPNVGGCPLCSVEKQHERKMDYGSEYAKERIIERFGNKYSFDSFVYDGDKENVTLICENHGPFSMRFRNLLSSCGCPECRKELELAVREVRKNEKEHFNALETAKKAEEKKISSQQVFIDRANKMHDGFYDYSKTQFKTMHEKVIITCPIHGEFEQLAYNHLNGFGCPDCGKEKIKTNNKKSVIQMTLSGDVIKTWDSISSVVIDGQHVTPAHISSCCTGYRKKAYGFKWKYDDTQVINQKILQKDKDDNIIKIWDSMSDINKNKPIKSTQHIIRCLNGKGKTAGGFKWEYATEN